MNFERAIHAVNPEIRLIGSAEPDNSNRDHDVFCQPYPAVQIRRKLDTMTLLHFVRAMSQEEMRASIFGEGRHNRVDFLFDSGVKKIASKEPSETTGVQAVCGRQEEGALNRAVMEAINRRERVSTRLYMKRFFEFYKNDNENRQQVVDDLEKICSILWEHHILIMTKCEDVAEALFYVRIYSRT